MILPIWSLIMLSNLRIFKFLKIGLVCASKALFEIILITLFWSVIKRLRFVFVLLHILYRAVIEGCNLHHLLWLNTPSKILDVVRDLHKCKIIFFRKKHDLNCKLWGSKQHVEATVYMPHHLLSNLIWKDLIQFRCLTVTKINC